jgi:hypothetical protein
MKGKTGKQWPTEKGQKDKHWSAKHYTENLEPIGMNVGNPEGYTDSASLVTAMI